MPLFSNRSYPYSLEERLESGRSFAKECEEAIQKVQEQAAFRAISLPPAPAIVAYIKTPCRLEIKKVIFNDPATIVFWEDGSKTIVKCQPGDTFSKETGIALAYMKRAFNNKGNFNNIFRKWVNDDEEHSD